MDGFARGEHVSGAMPEFHEKARGADCDYTNGGGYRHTNARAFGGFGRLFREHSGQVERGSGRRDGLASGFCEHGGFGEQKRLARAHDLRFASDVRAHSGAQELRVEIGCGDGFDLAVMGETGEDHDGVGHRRECLTREDIAHARQLLRDRHGGCGFAVFDVGEGQIERAHPWREVLIEEGLGVWWGHSCIRCDA